VPMGKLPEDPKKLTDTLKEGLGSIWGFSSDNDQTDTKKKLCLTNLNPSVQKKPYVTSTYKPGELAEECTETWNVKTDGSFSDSNHCIYSDGTDVSILKSNDGKCKKQWNITALTCNPKIPTCGADAERRCKISEKIGSCDCENKTYEEGDPCHDKCAKYFTCKQKCYGPLFAMQCQP